MRPIALSFRSKVSRLFRSAIASLLVMGIPRAVLAVTVVSIVLSVLVCGLAIYLTMPQMPFHEWFYYTAITPAIVSPIVSLAVFTLAYELAEAKAQLAKAAETDPLTGVGNRRRFYDSADRNIAQARSEHRPIALLMMDIDHFKILNDTYGHEAGDDALVAVAGVCAGRLRRTDLICRWGGEEFVILLPGCRLSDAIRIGEILREAVETLGIDAVPGDITVSIGAAEIEQASSLKDAIARADEQLYRAKEAGRNQVQPAAISP